mgnify:CR=1 FL=1
MTLHQLSQLYHLNNEIRQEQARLRELRAAAQSPSVSKLSDTPACTGDKSSRTERYTEQIVRLEAVIEQKLLMRLKEQMRLELYISQIPDSLTRQIFTLRFIKCYTWTKIAATVGGNTESSVKMRLTNTRLSFVQAGTELAYFSDNKLYVMRLEAVEQISIGTAANGYLDIVTTPSGVGLKWRT